MSRSGAQAVETGSPGIIIPQGWGQFWRPKRNAAGSGKATVAIIGDSLGRGYYSSNLNTKGWAALLRAALQSAYGDGGSGFQGVIDTAFYMNTVGVAAAAQTAYASQEPGSTGTWTTFSDAGPGGVVMNSTVAGSTLTFTVRGTSVTVYWPRTSTGGTLAWTIDGVTQTPISEAGASAIVSTTVSGLSDGTHTVVFTAPGTNSVGVVAVSSERGTGIVVNNYSRFASGAGNWNNTDTWGGVANWSGGPKYPSDLLIYALSVNDALNGVAADTWLQNVHRTLLAIRAVASPQTDILIVMNHVGNNDNASPVYGQYATRARGLAATFGAALVDLWDLGRNSWAYWNALGYWSGTDGSGTAGANAIHLSDAGHQLVANQILPVLTG